LNYQFAHHHLHTEYSPLDAPVKIKKLVEYSKQLGYKTVTVTDHGTVSSWVKLMIACKEKGMKPIFGIEGYFTQNRLLHEGGRDSYHCILIAKNSEGVKNIYKISEAAYREGFYYEARFDWELLEKYHEGVICTSACVSGIIPYTVGLEPSDLSLKGINPYEAAKKYAERFQGIFGKDFYCEVQCHGLDIETKRYLGVAKIAKELGIKILGTNDVHYLHKEDANTQEVMMAISTQKCIKDPNRMRHDTNQFYLKSPEEMVEMMGGQNSQAVQSALEIADICNAELNNKTQLPSIQIPKEFKSDLEYLEFLARQGLRRIGKENDPVYEARFKEEMDVVRRLREKGNLFDRYFLIVWDYVNWAWNNGIRVGVGRGSGAGSLLLYCLKITGVDPIPFDLLFERFLTEDRNEMPDIDIDFDNEGGDRVYEYVCSKYGATHCGKIATLSVFHAASAIKAAFRAFDPGNTYEKEFSEKKQLEQARKVSGKKGIQQSDKAAKTRDESAAMANEITKLLPKDPGSGRPSGKCTLLIEAKKQNDELIYVYDVVPEFKNLKIKYPEIFALAEQIEGLIEKRSVHAAGVLITEDELVNICPQQFSGKNKKLATAYDMNDAEKVGGVKFDFLQVKVLSIISKCIKTIEERYGKKIDIDHVDITDQKVIDLFTRADVAAVFQFESDFMRNILKQIRVDCFEDIIAANALGRPGPMDNIPLYCERKTGMKKVEYPVPMLESILKPTYGIMVYQEQVMKIVRVLAGFTASESDTVRKAMGKKKRDILGKLEDKFIKGCESSKTCPKEVAEDLWLTCEKFSEYAFNRSLNKDTLIPLSDGKTKRLEDMVKGDKVLCFDGEKTVETDVVALHDHNFLEGIEIKFDDGYEEICSINHKFLTSKGMVPLHKIIQKDIWVSSYHKKSEHIVARRIISAKSVGKKHMYDLEVHHPAHNFYLSNGVITSNSHATGYSYTAFQTAWLKVYYPEEFMAAQLTVEANDADYVTVKEYEQEVKRMGIKLLPVNINESKVGYIVSDIGNKKAIRRGFKSVMGLLQQASADIIANQPFRDMQDFCRRSGAGANAGSFTALLDMGAFDLWLEKLNTKLGKQATRSDLHAEYNDKFKRAKVEKKEASKNQGMQSLFLVDDEKENGFAL